MVEWLLTELGRWAELERVCGLSVTVGTPLVVTIEMRQPGKQFEAEMERWGYPVAPILSDRAKSTEKFTDKHQPWWEVASEG